MPNPSTTKKVDVASAILKANDLAGTFIVTADVASVGSAATNGLHPADRIISDSKEGLRW